MAEERGPASDETWQRLQHVRLAKSHLDEAEKALLAGESGELQPEQADSLSRSHVERARAVLDAPTQTEAMRESAAGNDDPADAWGAAFIHAYGGG